MIKSFRMVEISLVNLQKELRGMKNTKRADFLQRYFKCGKGEYAEGDVFIGGIDTPTLSKICDKYKNLTLAEIQELLKSRYHEERGAALGILRRQFEKVKGSRRKRLYDFYLKNTKYINNWDLVDTTAPKIVGAYIFEHPKETRVLDNLSRSKNFWERRMAVLSTFWFIKYGKLEKALEIGEAHLSDKEDLMRKAVGWMLREIGKKNRAKEEVFLRKHYQKMPRTMLRYAIEKFPETLRKKYLLGQV